MQKFDRDFRLDLLKTLGCALMIVAHSKLKMWNYERYILWGWMAPVLFFSVSGVTSSLQANRKTVGNVILTSAFIFALGFSYNGLIDPNFLNALHFEILQMIAVGAVVVFLVEKWFEPPVWMYLMLGAVSFALKFAIQRLIGGEAAGLTANLVAPGLFPVFPWLFLFFMGVFAYRVSNPINLVLALLGAAIFWRLEAGGFDLDYENRWDMSIGYFLLACIVLFSAYFLIRLLPSAQGSKCFGWLALWGRNSMLFLYVHFAVIKYFRGLEIQREIELIWNRPYLFWLLVAATTSAIMLAVLLTARVKLVSRVFDSLAVWFILTALVFAVPLIVKDLSTVYLLEVGIGVLFSAFYPRLSALIKRPNP
jgi:hypothetical protein